MSFFINILKGIVIGIGFIIPGVSGSALAVILGIYEKIILSISNIKKNFKESIIFLLPIMIGIIIGTIGFGNIVLYLLSKKEVATMFVFIGLIIGSIPSLINNIKVKSQDKIKFKYVIIAIIISLILFVIEKSNNGFNIENELGLGYIPIIPLVISGFLYAVGKIIPGISGAALLMLVGMYKYLLTLISNPLLIGKQELIVLTPFFIGALLGMIILFKLLKHLMNKYYIETYSCILGFVFGSTIYLLPKVSFNYTLILSLLLTIFSTTISFLLTNKRS